MTSSQKVNGCCCFLFHFLIFASFFLWLIMRNSVVFHFLISNLIFFDILFVVSSPRRRSVTFSMTQSFACRLNWSIQTKEKKFFFFFFFFKSHFVFIGPFLKNWRPCWLSFWSNNFTFKSSVSWANRNEKYKKNIFLRLPAPRWCLYTHTTMGDMFRGLCIRGGHPVPEGSAYID